MRANRAGVFAFFAALTAMAVSLITPVEAAVSPGSTPGNLSVGASGAAQYSLPLTLPPGVGGVMPQLSLQYSSQGDNGLLGVGWVLGGLYTINRCPQTMAQDGGLSAERDRFCLNGKRLILVSGTYGGNGAEYRTELDEFSRVVSYTSQASGGPDSFKVWTKDGLMIELGGTADSRLLATSTSSSADVSGLYGYVNTVALSSARLQWNANKISDRKSNFYSISYIKTDLTGEIYPGSISYTGNDAAGQALVSPANKITFAYQDRPKYAGDVIEADYPVQFLGGSKVSLTKRLTEIRILVDGVSARRYKLAYKGVDVWGASRSRLDAVTECTFDEAGLQESCYSPTQFEMSAFSGCIYDSYKSTLATAATVGSGTYVPLVQDFDGDGRSDLVSVRINSSGLRILDAKSANSVPSGTDFVDDTVCADASRQGQEFAAVKATTVSTSNYGASENWVVTSADVTGDGLPEIVMIPLNSKAFNPLVVIREADGKYKLGNASVADTSDYATIAQELLGGERAWLADSDGDGKQDIIAIKYTDDETTMEVILGLKAVVFFYRKGNGDGTFGQTVRLRGVVSRTDAEIGYHTFMGDANGDGRADLVFVSAAGGTISADAYLGSTAGNLPFNGWKRSALIEQSKFDNALTAGTVTRINFLDVNRDGLSDLVFFKLHGGTKTNSARNKAMVLTAMARGDGGFVAPDASLSYMSSDPMVYSTADASWYPWRTNFMDVNGDGRPDLIVTQVMEDAASSKNRLLLSAYFNRGNGRFVFAGVAPSTNKDEPSLADEATWSRFSGDFDGDGLGDLVSVAVNGTEGFVAFPVFARSPLPDLLTRVTDGNGAVTSVVQAPLTRDEVYTKGSSDFPKVAIRAPLYVVKTVTRDSGNGLASPTWSYTYSGAAVDVGGRGFLGFAGSTMTDPQGVVTATTFSQTFPYTGMVTAVSTTKDDVSLSSTANALEQKVLTHASGKTTYFPFVSASVVKQHEFTSGGALTNQISSTYNFDVWGNLREAVVTTTGDGNTHTQTITNAYFPNVIDTGTWRIGELSQKTDRRVGPLPDGSASDLTRTVAYGYDAYGQLATVDVEPTNAVLRTITTVSARDRFGNVQSTTIGGADITSRTESSVFDTKGRFVTSKTNAQGHITSFVSMNKRFGLPLSIKDPNAMFVMRQYDGFGRIVREQFRQTAANGTTTDGPFVTTEYLVCDSSCVPEQGEAFMVRVTPQGSAAATAYYDRNGRERRKVVKGMDGADIITAIEYDAMGRVARTSRPYFASSTDIQWISRTYDAVGRLAQEVMPGGAASTHTYSGRVTTITNPKMQATSKALDTLGRLVRTTDAGNSVQSFAYDAFGNLVRSTDAKGNLIINQYDLLGRKTRQQDPDLGIWNYRYNVLGELVWQQDARSQVTTFTYDKLGRPFTRAEPDLNSTWTWDTATKGIGKLAKLTGDNGFERNYSYDGFGRPLQSSTKKTIDPDAQTSDPDFVHSTTYDAAGRPEIITYPTGFGYKNVFDSNGYLTEIRHKTSNALYWRADARDAEGRITRETLGNGLVTDRKYKPDSGYIENIMTGTLDAGSLIASVQNDSYAFDVMGNLQMRNQYFGSNSLTEIFDYDNLNRLTKATLTNGAISSSVTANYDVLGNIFSRSDVGAYSYGAAISVSNPANDGLVAGWVPINMGNGLSFLVNGLVPQVLSSPAGICGGVHRVCGISGNLFDYDANGNMVSGNGRSYTWTSFNMPDVITKGSITDSFTYSADHERVRKVSRVNGAISSTTVYINPRIDLGGSYERTYKAGVTEHTHHLYAGGAVVGAVVTQTTAGNPQANPQTRYFHKDHLGSINAITNDARQVIERLSFDAWGKRRFENGSADVGDTIKGVNSTHGYTLHEHLDNIGLVHMNGRVYDPLVGRFVSADPNVFYPEDMQDFNRYSYVHNNPLSFIDPSGFEWEQASDDLMRSANVSMNLKTFEYMVANTSFINSQNLKSYATLTAGSSSHVTAASNQHGGAAVLIGNGASETYATSYSNSKVEYTAQNTARGESSDQVLRPRLWKMASDGMGVIGNGFGIVLGGALMTAPTGVSQVVGAPILAKSIYGFGTGWYNLSRAFSGDSSFDIPDKYQTLPRVVASGFSDDIRAQRLADATELALDLAGGRVTAGFARNGSGYLRSPVGYPPMNSNQFTHPATYSELASPATNFVSDMLQLFQTLQYGLQSAE